MTIKTGGHALVENLIQHGIKDLFLIPGIQLDWAVDALRQRSSEINLFIPRHEQTTTYMADGYFRASGQIGAAMVVPGPGALNTGAGLATAYASNSKVLFVTPQIHSKGVGKGYGLLHEIKDQTGFVAGLTKWNAMVDSADRIASTMDAAFAQLNVGRPRPVGVEVPHDYLQASVEQDNERSPEPAPVPLVDEKLIQAAAALINSARFPVIYAGGGVNNSAGAAGLRLLAEKIGAAVVASDNGRGALTDRHPLSMNSLAGRAVFQHADVIVVVGSRFIDAMTPTASWPHASGVRFIYLNIDPADVTPPRMPDVALVGDAAQELPRLAELLDKRTVLKESDALAVKRWAQAQIDSISPQADYVNALRKAMPDDAIFVNELTQIGYLARIAFPVYEPHTYIGPGYQGTLGYGFPVALGAAVGGGGRRVVSVTGDGGFGWNLQELATAKRYELPVTLIVFNDGHYGNVRAIQRREFGAEVAVELSNPDFRLLAQAFGVPFEQVETPDALGALVKQSINTRGPVMIEVKIGIVPSPWHLLRLQPMKGMTGPAAPANPLNEVI
ncbi:MAG: thiamine pyrophosphate-binding protein [Achromobacter sp.]|uniref:thiamine pyrophosphate-dependent enzyme n=1 Tax=Achromobacter sp. TaxID=134375 RepID=UPI0029AD1045|nr:thiamine pyrophosphate-dependent enzyme [Achromobacter sp.]MDX3985729.1 thiamine pyrophosphate-binding protein [Achromobacter sp.]